MKTACRHPRLQAVLSLKTKVYMQRIAIIGAGLSGLLIAKKLSEKAHITVFEKSRGLGGRMSTRYVDPFYFDHGAQSFTARHEDFQQFLDPFIQQGRVAEWTGQIFNLEKGQKESLCPFIEAHWVACPSMNSLCKALSQGIDVRKNCEIAPIGAKHDDWHLFDTEGSSLGHFDWVISTAPSEQTLRLFESFVPIQDPLRRVSMQACFALVLGFEHPWNKTWVGAKVHNNPIKWISVDSSKPGRNTNLSALVVHATNAWSEAHVDDDLIQVQDRLTQEFSALTGIEAQHAKTIGLHRWRYAIVDKSEKTGAYLNPDLKLAACSDWCESSRIEDVWRHANRLAELIIGD